MIQTNKLIGNVIEKNFILHPKNIMDFSNCQGDKINQVDIHACLSYQDSFSEQCFPDSQFCFKKRIMTERRPWTEEEDRMLKFVFEATKITKWSHIARRLQDEFGVKGRNGKQCKERYTTYIDPSYPKEEWSYEQQLKMFELHNELGNKWAIIGTKCGGKTDNSVKNHFYSRLRKALRKINQVIVEEFRKQHKQLKPPLLYKIVEVSEQRFKINPTFEKEFVCFSNQLKNQLLEFSYDEEDNQEMQGQGINKDMARSLIQKMNEFAANYKKKTKKQRQGSSYQQDLLTPHRYEVKGKRFHSQNDQSQQNSSFVNSSDMGNSQDISDDEINRSNTLTVNNCNKKLRRNSADNSTQTIEVPRIRTRSNSHGNNKQETKIQEKQEMKDQKFEHQENDHREKLQVEGILQGLNILQQDQNLPPHPLMMKKETSKYSRFSQGIIEKEEYHFFEDSQMQMRILPEVELGFGRDSQYQQSIFR